MEVSVVIPNYNGKHFLKTCLNALKHQSFQDMEVIVVDNGSTDGSMDYLEKYFPWVHVIGMFENYGFSRAVNEGIKAAKAPYVILLNNDTKPGRNFVRELYLGIEKDERLFSCSAKMLKYHLPEKIDNAGDYYSTLGWAFARGEYANKKAYRKEQDVFSSCAGAAIYRKKIFETIGYFDEAHFAYLEDIDVCFRARIYGYRNRYLPKALVYHVGSGTADAQPNQFRILKSARNSVYLIYKNLPPLMVLFNLQHLLIGYAYQLAKAVKKGYGKEYLKALWDGGKLCLEHSEKRVKFQKEHIKEYLKIEGEMLVGTVLRLAEFIRVRSDAVQ